MKIRLPRQVASFVHRDGFGVAVNQISTLSKLAKRAGVKKLITMVLSEFTRKELTVTLHGFVKRDINFVYLNSNRKLCD